MLNDICRSVKCTYWHLPLSQVYLLTSTAQSNILTDICRSVEYTYWHLPLSLVYLLTSTAQLSILTDIYCSVEYTYWHLPLQYMYRRCQPHKELPAPSVSALNCSVYVYAVSVTVECRSKDRTDGTDTQVLAQQPVPMSHRPPQLPYGLAALATAPTQWDAGDRTPEPLRGRFCRQWPAKYK